jgi:hypothetical protein
MKKILLAFFFLTGWFVPAHAQVEYGIIGGINFAYFNQVPPLSDAISSLGYMLGARASIGANIFLEPAVEFASYGSTITLDNSPINGYQIGTSHKMRSNYIRIPIEAGGKIFEASPVNVELRVGISESFLVGFTDDAGSAPAFAKSDISLARTGGIIGGGVRVFFLKLDLEYEWALTDFFKDRGNAKLSALYIILGGNF